MKNKDVEHSQAGIMENKVSSTSTLKPVLPLSPPWLELPEDVVAKILDKLGPVGILCAAQSVCTPWRKICRDPIMWRVIDMWKLRDDDGIYDFPYHDTVVLCRPAVDLSQGQVMEINIEYFGPDNLLDYIAERCGNLRCLGIAYFAYEHFHDEYIASLKKAVMGFPLLEELHLHLICHPLQIHDIEAIARSCPMLKTFSLNANVRIERIPGSNTEALGVATFMPELHHLQLIGSEMINDVLEVILNGCPKLESLDLRQCLNLDLEVELGKRCARQIKILRLPYASLHDYAWVDYLDY